MEQLQVGEGGVPDGYYTDGYSLYGGYFVPNSLDPAGMAECDCGGCEGLTDLKDLINGKVRGLIKAAQAEGADESKAVMGLGSPLNPLGGSLTAELAGLAKKDAKIFEPRGTKYDNAWAKLKPLLPKSTTKPCILLCGRCIGLDKLDHFFGESQMWLDAAQRTDEGGGIKMAEQYGDNMERGMWGLQLTGVYSRADLEANRQGGIMLSHLQLLKGDPRLATQWDICRYITDGFKEGNGLGESPNALTPEMARELGGGETMEANNDLRD